MEEGDEIRDAGAPGACQQRVLPAKQRRQRRGLLETQACAGPPQLLGPHGCRHQGMQLITKEATAVQFIRITAMAPSEEVMQVRMLLMARIADS